jgi:hypothetical protein
MKEELDFWKWLRDKTKTDTTGKDNIVQLELEIPPTKTLRRQPFLPENENSDIAIQVDFEVNFDITLT